MSVACQKAERHQVTRLSAHRFRDQKLVLFGGSPEGSRHVRVLRSKLRSRGVPDLELRKEGKRFLLRKLLHVARKVRVETPEQDFLAAEVPLDQRDPVAGLVAEDTRRRHLVVSRLAHRN